MLYTYYERNDTAVASRKKSMDTEMFCKVVQDIVNRLTSVQEMAIGEAEIVKKAREYFKVHKPWPKENTEPEYFFFMLRNFLDRRGQLHALENPQIAKNWCFMMTKLFPRHLEETIRLFTRSETKLCREPAETAEIEKLVREWDPGFKRLNRLFKALGYDENCDDVWLSVFKLLESKKKQPKDTSAGAGTTTRSSTDSAEDLDSLLELQASFPCVGCDGKHRFTARLASKDQFVVICPKWRDSKWDDPDVQRLRKKEKGLIADLWRKTDPKQPKENA